MKIKYKVLRIPEEAWSNLNKKKVAVDNILKTELKSTSQTKFTDFLRYFSKKPTYFYNDEVVNYFRKTHKKKSGFEVFA